jgi:TolB-like protein/tetratricopeptide (TPR) repeat protein
MSSAAGATISPDAVRSEVDKICGSAILRNSPRSCCFLRYVVEQTLNGQEEDLKEYSIGVEVYHRPTSYDPSIDSIVRNCAKRLRSKLRQYFESEGLRDEILVNFRPGSYVPIIRRRESLPSDVPSEPPTQKLRTTPLSLAVLPFANLSADSGTDSFAEGLTEEITHRISQVANLEVIARRFVRQFSDSNADRHKIQTELGVDLILEGTVRRDGLKLRITADLASTTDGCCLWRGRYDREMSDVFAVQDEIASAIVTTIRPQGAGFRAPTRLPQAVNLEAYSLYLRGRQLLRQQPQASLPNAIDSFETSISKWPTYARAHSGLADCYLTQVYLGIVAPRDGMPQAKAAALRALELDGELVEAVTSLASLALLYEWDWTKSESLFLRAIQLGAGETAHYLYGMLLTATGRFEEGREHLELAEHFAPLSEQPRVALALADYRHGNYDLAAQHLQPVLANRNATSGAYFCLSLIYSQQGRFDQALANAQRAQALLGLSPGLMASVGEIYACAGHRSDARHVQRQLNDLARLSYVPRVTLALLHIALGENDAALNCLQQGYEGREPWMIWLNTDPRYDNLRRDPRFISLVERMRLGGPSAVRSSCEQPTVRPIAPEESR